MTAAAGLESNWLDDDFFKRHPIPDGRLGSRPVDGGCVTVVSVEDLPVLIKAVGYLKYMFDGHVYLRGQQRLHSRALLPSALRGIKWTTFASLGAQVEKVVASSAHWSCDHVGHRRTYCHEKATTGSARLVGGGVPRYAVEPLLQHYGMKTRWLDVVDNLWVALWFACHRFVREREFVHVVRETRQHAASAPVYVVAVVMAGKTEEVAPGLNVSTDSGRTIDLRRAAPSYYIRPHAQHGLLVRPRDDDPRHITAVAFEISLENALTWLGNSLLLSAFGLYPPPTVDDGYRRLLTEVARSTSVIPHQLGYIDSVGPGY